MQKLIINITCKVQQRLHPRRKTTHLQSTAKHVHLMLTGHTNKLPRILMYLLTYSRRCYFSTACRASLNIYLSTRIAIEYWAVLLWVITVIKVKREVENILLIVLATEKIIQCSSVDSTTIQFCYAKIFLLFDCETSLSQMSFDNNFIGTGGLNCGARKATARLHGHAHIVTHEFIIII